ncbi:MAG: NUDIX domain-containing protein [Desulfatibacillum sp.]|nr:NUDIX domain-containing protein [Desulfatibacillum sp.]
MNVTNGEQTQVEVRDASTVILVRDGEQGPEIFLVARTSSARSFAGVHVFPGGVVDEWDTDPDLDQFSRAPDTKGLKGFLGETPHSLGIFFCALRETFEEAGVLFASGLPDTGVSALWDYREPMVNGKIRLAQMAREKTLRLLPDRLVPHRRWITPENVRKRWDTRFFLARLPRDQEPVPDEGEVTQGLWVRPDQALEEYKEGRLNLMPPTFMNLLSLCGKKDADEIFAAREKQDIRPVLPQPFKEGNTMGLLLPHDPDYGIPEFKQSPRTDEPSRVVMENGRWIARCK